MYVYVCYLFTFFFSSPVHFFFTRPAPFGNIVYSHTHTYTRAHTYLYSPPSPHAPLTHWKIENEIHTYACSMYYVNTYTIQTYIDCNSLTTRCECIVLFGFASMMTVVYVCISGPRANVNFFLSFIFLTFIFIYSGFPLYILPLHTVVISFQYPGYSTAHTHTTFITAEWVLRRVHRYPKSSKNRTPQVFGVFVLFYYYYYYYLFIFSLLFIRLYNIDAVFNIRIINFIVTLRHIFTRRIECLVSLQVLQNHRMQYNKTTMVNVSKKLIFPLRCYTTVVHIHINT